jgi:hypothetical protein
MQTQRTPEELKKAVAVLKRTYSSHTNELGILIYQALKNVRSNNDLDVLFNYKYTMQKTEDASVVKYCMECIQFEFIDLYK